MYLVVLGIIGITMKWLEYGPVATWPWWLVLSPFALAMAWWTYADVSGRTARAAMAREEKRRLARIERNRANTGTSFKRR
jgi:small Trp-rich protein